jgi:hypothetical protein
MQTQTTVSPLRQAAEEIEVQAMRKYAQHIRDILRQTTPKDIYPSIVAHRRKLMDLTIWCRKTPLEALLFQRAIPKPQWVRGASWRLEQDYDLIAWLEIEEDAKVQAIIREFLKRCEAHANETFEGLAS